MTNDLRSEPLGYDDNGDRLTVGDWYDRLTEDRGRCFSRYGDYSDECAWWAIALAWIYAEANGDETSDATMQLDMIFVVNDHDSVAELVLDNWHALPRQLRQHLGTLREVRSLLRAM